MPKPFKIYRIVCLINDKSLIGGTDQPTEERYRYWYGRKIPIGKRKWYERGVWSLRSGAFWKTEAAVKLHLQNLCHDWRYKKIGEKDACGFQRTIVAPIKGSLDWTRLQHFAVDKFIVTNYSTERISAPDFIGLLNMDVAA